MTLPSIDPVALEWEQQGARERALSVNAQLRVRQTIGKVEVLESLTNSFREIKLHEKRRNLPVREDVVAIHVGLVSACSLGALVGVVWFDASIWVLALVVMGGTYTGLLKAETIAAYRAGRAREEEVWADALSLIRRHWGYLLPESDARARDALDRLFSMINQGDALPGESFEVVSLGVYKHMIAFAEHDRHV